MLGALGGLIGLGGGLIANAFDNSEEEAEEERRRSQQLALGELQGARAYMPTVDRGNFNQAQAQNSLTAQHGAGGMGAQQEAQQRALQVLAQRKKPEDEGYL